MHRTHYLITAPLSTSVATANQPPSSIRGPSRFSLESPPCLPRVVCNLFSPRYQVLFHTAMFNVRLTLRPLYRTPAWFLSSLAHYRTIRSHCPTVSRFHQSPASHFPFVSHLTKPTYSFWLFLHQQHFSRCAGLHEKLKSRRGRGHVKFH